MKWILKDLQEDKLKILTDQLSISATLARILMNRGIDTVDSAHSFLKDGLRDIFDPFLLPDMEKAAERILIAREKKEKIIIHADYDVDGTTAAALLYWFFKDISVDAECFVPHRYTEGYGISEESAEKCVQTKASLLISVDCGITSVQAVEYLTRAGVDVIITDHHLPGPEIPKCLAVINPQLSSNRSPFQGLAGVGVAFKLAHAIIKTARTKNCDWAAQIDLKNYLEFVAIGSVSDMASLKGENRIMVKKGLEYLTATQRSGLQALKEVCNISGPVTSEDIAYKIGPRLNASGRIYHAMDTINLLISQSLDEARQLAKQLDRSNDERRYLEQDILKDAEAMILSNDYKDDLFYVIASANWSEGVIGIVASKLMNKYHKPVLLLSVGSEWAKGSARSPKHFHLKKILDEVGSLFKKYGGHANAAGLTIDPAKISELRKKLNLITKRDLTEEHLEKVLYIDAEIPQQELSSKILIEMDMLEPFGQSNEQPVFLTRNVSFSAPPKFMGNDHIKITISSPFIKDNVEVVGFFMGNRFEEIKSRQTMDIVYELKWNSFRGDKRLQCVLRDFK